MLAAFVAGLVESADLTRGALFGMHRGRRTRGAVARRRIHGRQRGVQVPIGLLADRYGRKTMLAVCAWPASSGLVAPVVLGVPLLLWPLLFVWGGPCSVLQPGRRAARRRICRGKSAERQHLLRHGVLPRRRHRAECGRYCHGLMAQPGLPPAQRRGAAHAGRVWRSMLRAAEAFLERACNRDPVHLPCLAAIVRKRLFKAA